MIAISEYTADFEREIDRKLHYDVRTGIIYWKRVEVIKANDKTYNGQWANKVAGTVNSKGYVRIALSKKYLLGHRVAWRLHHGKWPNGQIDHINNIRHDNRIINLRDVSASENKRNTSKHRNNKSGITGVVWVEACWKWRAQIKVDNQYKSLGFFENLHDAEAARLRAESEFMFSKTHGKFVNIYEDAK